jgi:D-cysteine desulfhydrase
MDLDRIPRFRLAALPTPLEEAPRLSGDLGVRILFKRDDLTGLALGGNKARKLEFLLPEALSTGAEVVVTAGGPQSNHARTTAAAARRAGLNAVLLLAGEPPQELNGNLLLDKLLEAEIRYVPTGGMDEQDRRIAETVDALSAAGRKAYAVPYGGSSPLGALGYLFALRELVEQLEKLQVRADSMFVTTGSCGTHAGILAGIKYFDARIPLYGISVSLGAAECARRIRLLVSGVSNLVEKELALNESDVSVEDRYLPPGYGVVTPGVREAIRLVARTEGILLDPVYTGKAMSGLVDMIRRGEVRRGSTVVFWHTGGQPGLFAKANDL